MGEFTMPALGVGMDVGRVLEWYVHPGDEVHRGDVIALVETDKAAIEVEVFEDGVIGELLVDEGTTVPVGTALARIGAEPVAVRPVAREVPAHRPAAPTATLPPPPPRHPTTTEAGRLRVSPWARRLGARRHVDLREVTGSGPDGAVVARDLAATTPTSTTAPEPPGEAMRRAIARAVARSKREIPHYYLGHTVDLEDTLQWLEARNADRPAAERVLPAVLVLKATSLACRAFPEMNGSWVDDAYRAADAVHVGVAIALRGGGLVAPAIHDLDARSLDDVMAALTDLVTRARAGRLRASELADATITVTNLGDRGVHTVYGVIQPPQVALVGTGRIDRRPWVVDSEVVPRRVLDLTLSADHRVSDGHRGARFLDDITRRLQVPEEL